MKKIILAIIAISTLAIGSHAEESISTTNRVQKGQSITIVGSKLAAYELAASGEYLDSSDIRTHSYDNINILARKMPGVYAQEETGLGLLANISLRGVDTHRSQKITMMEDGILTAPAAYSAPSAYYTPTLGRMSGLEVMKGSSQIKYGPHTTGGALNYLSTPIPNHQAFYLKSSYGTDNDVRLHGNAGNTFTTDVGTFGYVAELYHHQTDGFKTINMPMGPDDEQTGFDKTDTMVKLMWEPNTASYQQFEFKVGYTDFDANETYLGLSEADFKNDPFQRYAASQFDNFTGEHFRSYLKHLIEFNEQTLNTTAYYQKFHRNWYKLNDIIVDGTKVNLARAIANGGNDLDNLKGAYGGTWRIRANNRDYELYGIQTAYEADFMTGDIEHHIEAGGRLHVDTAERFQWQDEYQVDSLGNVTNIAYGAKGGAGNRKQQAAALALYLQDELSVERFSITPGIRYEHIENQYIDRNDDNVWHDGSMDVFGFGVNSKYQFTPASMLFGGVYRGYSVPSPYDNLKAGMEEETSIGCEIGTRYGKNHFNAQLIGFYTRIEDMISGGYVGGATDTDGANAGKINSAGLEASAGFDLGQHQNWGFKNPYWIAFTYTDAVLAEDTNITDSGNTFVDGKKGNQVPYIPKLQLSCGTGMEIGRTGIDLTLMYVGETYTTASNASDQFDALGNPDARYGKTDAHLIFNGSAYYRITDNTKVFINLRNMLNEEYIASRHPYGPRPGQPFSAMLGLEASF